ncbi:MAG: helix-hairpin-helix domain-containing protein [Chloroflexota bacterium]|nr:helix-hairpin-helix domain-containing protein [Chloroflexota bacterium]
MSEDRSLRHGVAATLLLAALLIVTNQIVARAPLTDAGLALLLGALGLGVLFVRLPGSTATVLQEMLPVYESGLLIVRPVPAPIAATEADIEGTSLSPALTMDPVATPAATFTPAPPEAETLESMLPEMETVELLVPLPDVETQPLPIINVAETAVETTPAFTPTDPPANPPTRESAADVPPAGQAHGADAAPADPPSPDAPGADAPSGDEVAQHKPVGEATAAPATPAADPVEVQAAIEHASGGEKRLADDLTRIHGIGPKIAGALRDLGIDTFAKLAAADQAQLQAALEAVGAKRLGDPGSWIEQAPYAARADWEGMQRVIDTNRTRGTSAADTAGE